MSSSLGWLPVKPSQHKWLDTDIKFAMRNRYGNPINETLDSSQLDYLRGLRDSGIKDAEKLIKAIEKYGEIRVEEIF